MRTRVAFLGLTATLLSTAACSNAGSDRVLAVSATGTVSGVVYFDADGSSSLTAGDDSLRDVRVELVPAGDTTRIIETTLSQPSGSYRFTAVPVGAYAVRVDPATIGDTVAVLKVDSARVTLLPSDSALVNVGVGFPAVSIAAARALPVGRKVFLTGLVLNNSTAFEDSVVHLVDTSAAIRLTRLRAPVGAGDSVRVRGTTARRDALPTFDDVRVVPLGAGLAPAPNALSVPQAGTAGGGTRDAALAEVRGVTVAYTTPGTASTTMIVSDGTDSLEVLLDGNADPSFRPGQLGVDYIRGNRFDIVGVLQPKSPGVWRLKPRSAADLTLLPLPVIGIAAARALPAGRLVVVVGVALNGSSTFSDTTVHLADNTGAIRMARLRSSFATADSVKVRATTGLRDGQPTLDDVTSTPLGTGLIPGAVALTTQRASTADGGTRDAALVIVRNATVSDTATVLGDFKLTVSDGSGSLEVRLDGNADPAFRPPQLPGVYVPGNKFDIVGVLVPAGTGTWKLKPRAASDLSKL
jgi:hypothetical protein